MNNTPTDYCHKTVSLTQEISTNKTFTCFVVGETSLVIRCVEHLLQQGHIILGVFSKDHKVNAWADQQGMTCFKNKQLCFAALRQQEFDYLFSIVNSWVIPSEILSLPRKKAINYHDSPLPRYAGVNATVHALRHREPYHGISWHEMAEGIDTGDILQQVLVDILPGDTALSLNIRCYEAAFSAYTELVQALAEETVNPIKQNLAERSYYGRWDRPKAACVLNWNDTAEKLDALIRALDMGAYHNPIGLPKCLIGEQVFIPSQTEVLTTASAQAPGVLLAVTDTAIQIATGSQDLAIHRLLSMEGESLPAAEWMRRCDVQAGQVLPNINAEQTQNLSQLDKRYCRHEAYWIEQLSAVRPVSLPHHRAMLADEADLPPYTQIRFPQTCDAVFLTLSFAVLLARFSQSYTLTLGFSSPALRQDITGYEPYFAQQIPLNLQIEAKQTFSETLQLVREQLDELHNKGNYLVDLILRKPMLTAPNGLFTITWVESAQDPLLQQRCENVLLIKTTGACCYWPAAWHYLAKHFQQLVNAIIQYPDTPLYQLPLLDKQAIQQLQAWNNTATDYPKDLTVVDLFEQQVEKTPNKIAVVFEGQHLTYRVLNHQANQVAHALIERRVQADTLVGICVERSLEMVIGLLGILKAGGAYVPIDPSYPQARIAYMLEDSAVPVLLIQSHLKKQLPELRHACVTVCLDDVDFTAQDTKNPELNRHVEDLAYVIYTSGSTGEPKGVMVGHQALFNHMHWMQCRFAFTTKDKILQKTPFSFDASVWEFYASLLTGGTLVLAKPQGHTDINYLFRLLNQKQITVLQLVPSLLKVMLKENEAVPNSLRYIFCGGEVFSQEIHRKYYSQIRNTGFYNLYGPTEACIDATCWESRQLADISIGQPIANTRIHILDAAHQPRPIGIPGELCITGRGLARGYLNRPKLTAEKFIEVELFGKTERIYKTGDLARWLPDGNLEYLGRIDNQVKLRGFRIELGEIEAVLSQHPAVKEAIVTLYEADDNKRLAAYITEDSGNDSLIAELRKRLKDKLPDYMIPSHFNILERLPLTPNGKVDRKALPAPQLNLTDAYEVPRNDIEQKIADVWSRLFKHNKIGIHDDFFHLGGDSLLSIQMIACAGQAGLQITLQDLIQHHTIAGLAAVAGFDAEKDAGEASLTPIAKIPDGKVQVSGPDSRAGEGGIPLSFIQERMWVHQTLRPSICFYNISCLFQLTGKLDIAILRQSFNEIINRHEILRTTFPKVDGSPVQSIAPASTINISIKDLQGLSEKARSDEVERLVKEVQHHPFDVFKGPLLRVMLMRLEEQSHVLFFGTHHIIFDMMSGDIFFKELCLFYETILSGKSSPLPALPIQYANYAVWQHRSMTPEARETKLNYWKQWLANGEPPPLAFPSDKHLPAPTFRAGAVHYQLPSELTEKLKSLSRRTGITLFTTMLTTLTVLLYRYSGCQDIVVGSPFANRNHWKLEQLIGYIGNSLLLRIEISENSGFSDLLSQVQQVVLEAITNQDLPFDQMEKILSPESKRDAPLSKTFISFFPEAPIEKFEFSDITMRSMPLEPLVTGLDLFLIIWEKKTPSETFLQGFWRYNKDIFDAKTVVRMTENFQAVLEAVVTEPSLSVEELPMLL
ncbi:amino acid adenylation domain-containing protein [Desulfobulbus sp. TB]|nr:amino acid adenylation domain-containing protein [Desulfobulbus sp. TB]